MPLRPNFTERARIRSGAVPGAALDLLGPLSHFWAMALAAELGLFEKLHDGPVELDALARKTRASQAGLEPLVQALMGLGYLEYRNELELPHGEIRPGGYLLTKAARRALPAEGLRATAAFWRSLAASYLGAADAVRTGSAVRVSGKGAQSRSAARGSEVAMRWLASGLAEEVVQRVLLPPRARRILEAGDGQGVYAIAFCRRHESLCATVVGPPVAVRGAKAAVAAAADVAERIEVVRCDVTREPIPTVHDLVVLAGVLHGLAPERCRRLLAGIAERVSGRGAVAIVDHFGGRRGSPLERSFGGLLGLHFFLSAGAHAHPSSAVVDWLVEAGFSETSRCGLVGVPGMSLVVGRKTIGP